MRPTTTATTLTALALALAPLAPATHAQAAPQATPDASDQMTLDEVLDAHFEAVGGREMIASIDSAKITGTMTMGPGMEAPFTIYWQDPDKIRMEFTVQGTTGVQAYDGEVGWMHMPFMGAAEPQRMPEDQLEQIEQQADLIEGPLFDYQEKGHTVEYLGTEEVEGTKAHKLHLTMKNGDESTIYLDADHFLQIRSESTVQQGEQEVETVTSFGSFKEVEGYVLPHTMTMKLKGAPAEAPSQTMTIDGFEFGVDVSEVEFSMPETTAADAESGEEPAAASSAPAEAGAEEGDEASDEEGDTDDETEDDQTEDDETEDDETEDDESGDDGIR